MSRAPRTHPTLAPGVDPGTAPGSPRSGQASFIEPVFALVLVCFFLSGFAALLYQTAWLRQFSIVFGTSEFAVASVLASYMGGLAIGAAVATRFVTNIRRPILVYGALEGGIALAALAAPVLIQLARQLFILALGGQPAPPSADNGVQTIFFIIVAFAVLMLPTAFMGATLPLLARYAVHEDRQIGPRIGLLYGVNTAGAVAGVVAAGFWLLPVAGLFKTTLAGVLSNAAVFGAALLLHHHSRNAFSSPRSAVDTPVSHSAGETPACLDPKNNTAVSLRRDTRHADWILPLIAISGAISFLYEVLWTRMLSHVLGGTIYAFSAMLASFLTGIAIGGAIAGQFAKNKNRSMRIFAATQAAIAVLSFAVYYWLSTAPPIERGLAQNALLSFLVMTPSAFFIGATFPLAVRIAANDAKNTARASARVYAWNTSGAIIGSLAAVFAIIPALQFAGAIKLAIVANLTIAVISAALSAHERKLRTAALGAASITALLLLINPREPLALVASSALARGPDQNAPSQQIFYEVGRSATVHVSETGGDFFIRTNGLPEARSEPAGAAARRNTQAWLGALPFAVRPEGETALIIGFGGGLAVTGAPPSVASIDVIELEPAVIDANRAFADLRREDPLADPRARIIINDARSALSLTVKKYDAIISQPSHPWTPGASHLYTKEFMALVHGRLREDGVFLQWINASFISEELLRSLAATLTSEFDHVILFQPDPMVLFFLASDEPMDPVSAFQTMSAKNPQFAEHFSSIGVKSVADIAATIAIDEAGVRKLAGDSPLNTDDLNMMATKSNALGNGLDAVTLEKILAPLDPLLRQDSPLRRALPAQTAPYIARRLIETGFESRALDFAQSLESTSERELLRGIGLRHHGRHEQAHDAFVKAAIAGGDDQAALYAIVQPFLGAVSANRAPPEITSAASRLSGQGRTVLQGWRFGFSGDWDSLEALDNELAAVPVTALWRPEAVKLRLDWRIQQASRRQAPELAEEAIALADDLLSTYETADIFALRAAAALITEKPSIFAESLRGILTITESDLARDKDDSAPPGRSDLERARRRIEGMTSEGARIFGDAQHPQIQSVSAAAKQTLARIDDALAAAD